jgi:CubicO group peptidase (beta-lactamase class C family)
MRDRDMHDVMDRCAERAVRTYPRSALVIGILRSGRQHVFGYGTLDPADDPPRPPDGNTLFEIGSITKVFTSTLLAASVRARLALLDAPATAYLPPYVHLPDEVTLLALATHTSGLPRLPPNIWRSWLRHPRKPYAAYTERHLHAALGAYRPGRPAAGTFRYSNLGGGLLGYLLARVYSLPYEVALRREICGPLGLERTWVTLPPHLHERLAHPRTARGRRTPTWDAPVRAGTLRSTATDLLRFLRAQLGDAPTALADTLHMHHPVRAVAPAPGYGVGLGWMVSRFGDDAVDLHWHDGATGGSTAFLGLVGAREMGVVALSNHSPDSLRRRNWACSPGAIRIAVLDALCS